jgi:hypothetical protein
MREDDPPGPTKTYSGSRTGAGCVVAVTTTAADGVTVSRLLNPRLDLCAHSSHFEWGDEGRGAAQLALAILAHYLEDGELAIELHHRFKVAVVGWLPYQGWMLRDEDVAKAILRLRQ